MEQGGAGPAMTWKRDGNCYVFHVSPYARTTGVLLSDCRSVVVTILDASGADNWTLVLPPPAQAFRWPAQPTFAAPKAHYGQTELKLCHVGYVMLRVA